MHSSADQCLLFGGEFLLVVDDDRMCVTQGEQGLLDLLELLGKGHGFVGDGGHGGGGRSRI